MRAVACFLAPLLYLLQPPLGLGQFLLHAMVLALVAFGFRKERVSLRLQLLHLLLFGQVTLFEHFYLFLLLLALCHEASELLFQLVCSLVCYSAVLYCLLHART